MKRSDLAAAVAAQLVRLPPPHQAHFGVVPLPPPPNILVPDGLRDLLARALAGIAVVDAIAERRGPDATEFLVARTLRLAEAVGSSRIEGTFATLEDLLIAEADQAAIMADDVPVVLAYATALDAGLTAIETGRPFEWNATNICALHRILMAHDRHYRDLPGQLREVTVWIGGGPDIARSIYNPPPADRVTACLQDQVNYLNDDHLRAQTPLPTRMTLAHAHFEAIHPFRDGNGRTGRMLWPLMMAADGHQPLYLAGHIDRHKQRYLDALKQAQQRLIFVPLLEVICEALVWAAADIQSKDRDLGRLTLDWLERRRFRDKSAARRTLDFLAYRPIVTIDGLARTLDVTFPAAARAIEQLVEARILVETTGRKHARRFKAPEALEVLQSG